MSPREYNSVDKMCLIDLPRLPRELVEKWLSTKSEWTQIQFRRFIRN